MPSPKNIEEIIRSAIEAGEFDNLRGKGKPQNLDDYFAAPEDVRAGYALLKNNDFIPQEVELLKEIGGLREKIKSCPDEAERKRLAEKLRERALALTMILERNRRKRT